jgi:hypothetical protein
MRRALLLGIPFAFLVAGCTYDNGDTHNALYNGTSSQTTCGTATQSAIDTDAQIDIDAGQGAGIFIEYQSGGHYHVRTSCDTTLSNSPCHWDVIVDPQSGTTISNVAGENLEGSDSVHTYPPPLNEPNASPSYQLTTETTTEIDGFTFDIDPGASITVDALLDGACAVPFFFWIGDGALHQGSPSNPLTLVPSSN